MKIIKSDLFSAVEKNIINQNQANELWDYFESSKFDQPKFQLLHILYGSGGVLILASMLWFFKEFWASGGLAIMFLSFFFAVICLIIGNNLWNKKDLKIPAGILISLAVCFTPLFIYGFQLYTGVNKLIYLELGAIISSLLALRFYKFAFIAFPFFLSVWLSLITIASLIFDRKITFEEQKVISYIYGCIVLVISYFIDKKYKEVDFAFWGYLFGIMSMWGVLTLNIFLEFNYFILNILFIISSIYLRRKIFFIFGAIGAFSYLSHLFYVVFNGSFLLPLAIAITGLMIIFLGIKYQKNKQKIELIFKNLFPKFLLKWRPEERI